MGDLGERQRNLKKGRAKETMETEGESRRKRQWEYKGEIGVLGRSKI